MKDITLVIPAKSESECLPKVLNELKKFSVKKIIVIPKNDTLTFESVKKHNYTNVFSMPHHSDITSHLNFKLFDKILKKNNLNVEKIINQNEFLKKVGILERANILSKKMTFKEKANMFYRLKRLLDPKEMGDLFKVIFAQKKNKNFSLGF